MKSPRYPALQQIHVLLQYPHKDVEMKSPRYWALQPYIIAFIETIITVEMKSPRHWALQLFKSDLPAHFISRRKEKPETLGIATQKVLTLSPEGLGVEKKSPK